MTHFDFRGRRNPFRREALLAKNGLSWDSGNQLFHYHSGILYLTIAFFKEALICELLKCPQQFQRYYWLYMYVPLPLASLDTSTFYNQHSRRRLLAVALSIKER